VLLVSVGLLPSVQGVQEIAKVEKVELQPFAAQVQRLTETTVRVTAKVAALLNEKQNLLLRLRNYRYQPYWDIERARIIGSREVPVEVIVNGEPVARKNIVADGVTRELAFDVPLERSSWVALRILPSSHTNPIFISVGGKPIRASRESAEWCLKSVDQCWSQKSPRISAKEREEAEKAYEHARRVYRELIH
jgi:hypothetical protein